MNLTLYTSRFGAKDLITASGLAPVRISIGHPRWKLGYELTGACKLLMPTRDMLKLDEPTYRALYLGMLEKAGVDAIAEDLARLCPAGAPGLVLLCFEDLTKPGEWCHRRIFADFWLEKTGEGVPELGAGLTG
jgi:hypothetical protein